MNGLDCIYLCRLTRKAGEQLALKMGQGLSQQQAWNKSSIDLVKASHVSMMSRVGNVLILKESKQKLCEALQYL